MSFVQTANSGAPGGVATTKALTFASAQSAANCNVVLISYGSSTGAIIDQAVSSVVDTKGNSYVAATSFKTIADGTAFALGQIIYIASNIAAANAGANTVTVTLSAAAAYFAITILEYSGIALSSPLDVKVENGVNGPGATTIGTTGPLSTTLVNDTLVGALCFFDGPAGTGLAAGFTQRANFYTTLAADQVGVPVGTYTLSATANGGGSGWVAQMIALLPPSAGPLVFPIAIADTSTVVTLGFRVARHFPIQIADTSTVLALGFHQITPLRFPIHVADTSTVVALGFHQITPPHFPVQIADTSTVLALGFRVNRRFPLAIADTSTVHLSYTIFQPRFPLAIQDTSMVLALGFENDHAAPPRPPIGPLVVPPYAGKFQQVQINMRTASPPPEEGPEVMPPNPYTPERSADWLPPPVKQLDIFLAQQTWPL